MHPRFNTNFRTFLLASRWGMAPFCLGLLAALVLVMAQFFRELAHTVLGFTAMGGAEVIIAVLKLVDLVLVANLVVMIIGAAVEVFLPSAARDESGSGIVDFAELKLKVFGSISAIAAIDLLENFIDIDSAHNSGVLLEIAMLLTFVLSGVLLAWMDRLATERR